MCVCVCVWCFCRYSLRIRNFRFENSLIFKIRKKTRWLFRGYVYIDNFCRRLNRIKATTVEWEQWAVSDSESDNNDDYTPYTA